MCCQVSEIFPGLYSGNSPLDGDKSCVYLLQTEEPKVQLPSFYHRGGTDGDESGANPLLRLDFKSNASGISLSAVVYFSDIQSAISGLIPIASSLQTSLMRRLPEAAASWMMTLLRTTSE